MEVFNFTNTRLKKLTNITKKNEEYRDSGKKGLFLRVTPAGKKVFRLRLWNPRRKREERLTLGEYPEISIQLAREMVDSHLSDIAQGIDAVERLKREREEQSLDDVFKIWLEQHAKINMKRWEQEEARYYLYIQPHLGKKRLSEITPDLINRWKVKLSKQPKFRGKGTLSPSLIGRAQITLSSIFGKAAPQITNPCSQVEKHKPKKRDVFLTSSQLEKFFTALDDRETHALLRDYCLLSLYTGARRENVLAMRWAHIDLNLKLWLIPGDEMKNSEGLVLPLTDQAVKILDQRKKGRSSIFVFPSPKESKTGHYQEPKKAWKGLLKRAGLPQDIRLHDLRRTMGSWQAITGASTKIIGASLGHKSEQATSHYAHLTINPVRDAMQRAADEMEKQGKTRKVVNLVKKK